LSLVVALKCFQRLGYFPSRWAGAAGDHRAGARASGAGRCGGVAAAGSDRALAAAARSRAARRRVGSGARAIARGACDPVPEAEVKNHPPDLINVVLEVLVRERFELPAFSTLDEIATRARAEVNAGMLSGIVARMRQPEVLRLNNLLDVADGKSGFDGLKRAAGKALWSHFRAQVAPPAVGRLARRWARMG
jgi:hypothetical protein